MANLRSLALAVLVFPLSAVAENSILNFTMVGRTTSGSSCVVTGGVETDALSGLQILRYRFCRFHSGDTVDFRDNKMPLEKLSEKGRELYVDYSFGVKEDYRLRPVLDSNQIGGFEKIAVGSESPIIDFVAVGGKFRETEEQVAIYLGTDGRSFSERLGAAEIQKVIFSGSKQRVSTCYGDSKFNRASFGWAEKPVDAKLVEQCKALEAKL